MRNGGGAQFKRLLVERIDSGILHGPNKDVKKKDTAKDHANPKTFWEEDSGQEAPLQGPLDHPPLDIHGDAARITTTNSACV